MPKKTEPDPRVRMREMSRLCLAHRVKRAARAVTRLYDDLLDEVDLTSTQLTLLCAIEIRPDLHMQGLGELLVLEQSALSRAVGVLKKRGLVVVTRGVDRRERLVALTDAGRELAVRAHAHWQAAQAQALAVVDGRDAFFAALDRLATLPGPRPRESRL